MTGFTSANQSFFLHTRLSLRGSIHLRRHGLQSLPNWWLHTTMRLPLSTGEKSALFFVTTCKGFPLSAIRFPRKWEKWEPSLQRSLSLWRRGRTAFKPCFQNRSKHGPRLARSGSPSKPLHPLQPNGNAARVLIQDPKQALMMILLSRTLHLLRKK